MTAEIASTIIDFDGAPAVLAYARDVTDRARLRARLAHADRLTSLGRMAAGIAHEINNPLAFMGLAAEVLQGRVSLPETTLVRELRDGIDRIAGIVRDLQSFVAGRGRAGWVGRMSGIDLHERVPWSDPTSRRGSCSSPGAPTPRGPASTSIACRTPACRSRSA
jgi:signal transduction histidine kinase